MQKLKRRQFTNEDNINYIYILLEYLINVVRIFTDKNYSQRNKTIFYILLSICNDLIILFDVY